MPMSDFEKILGFLFFIGFVLLVMLSTPTLITVSGTVVTPVGMSPNGTVVQLYNTSGLLVGQQTVGESGAFRVVSSSRLGGTYKITASNGDAARTIQVGVGYGNNDVGVIALEKDQV